jgi:hypothetical protein
MKFVQALNSIDSRVWAVVLIMLGIGSIALSVFFHEADVRTAIFSTGNGLVLVAAAIFQHPKSNTDETDKEQA